MSDNQERPVLMTALLAAQTVGGGQQIEVEFGAGDRHRYLFRFTLDASARLAAALGSLLANLKGQPHLTVTVEESSALAAAEGSTALCLTTLELGAIAFVVDRAGIAALRRDLDDLERVQPPGQA